MAAEAAADALEDVRIKDDEMQVRPLKAVTPQAAEELADRFYGMMPGVRHAELLARMGARAAPVRPLVKIVPPIRLGLALSAMFHAHVL